MFDPVFKSGELRRATFLGLSSTVVAQGVRQAISLMGTIVVARRVMPFDFGLVAMVAAPLGFLETLRDLSLTTICIQAPRLDHDQVNAFFWINAVLGAIIAAAACVAAPWLARFYHAPAITEITFALTAGLAAASLCVEHYGLLRRQMRFTQLAILDTTSTTLSVILGIWAACAGWGYRAVLVQILSARIANVAGTWVLCAWRPTLTWRPGAAWALVRSGVSLTGASLLGSLARSLDAIVLARVTGPRDVGLYTRGLSIGMLPVGLIEGPLSAISFSALSRLQHDAQRSARAATLFLRWLTTAMTGMALVLALAPDLAIAVILGHQWSDTAPLLAWLALLTVALPLSNAAIVIATAFGQMQTWIRCASIAALIIASAVVWGAMGGAHRLAMAYAIVSLLTAMTTLSIVLRSALPAQNAMLRAVAPALIAGLSCWMSATLLESIVSSTWNLAPLAATALRLAAGGGIYGLWACWHLQLHHHLHHYTHKHLP